MISALASPLAPSRFEPLASRQTGRRAATVARALPQLPRFELPSWLNAGAGKRATKAPFVAERDELLSILLGGDEGSSKQQRERRASELVDALLESQQPFKEQLLAGGPWVVVYTKGALQLWRATWQTGKLLSGNGGNEASQDFDPVDRSALNKAEFWGGSVFVTASGTYTPLVGCAREVIYSAVMLISLVLPGFKPSCIALTQPTLPSIIDAQRRATARPPRSQSRPTSPAAPSTSSTPSRSPSPSRGGGCSRSCTLMTR
jgi:hypothetical protein